MDILVGISSNHARLTRRGNGEEACMSFVIARDICFMPIDTGSAAMPSSSHPTFNSLHPDFADTRQPAHHALRPSSLLELFACIPSLKDRYLGRGVAKKLKHPRTLGPCRPRFNHSSNLHFSRSSVPYLCPSAQTHRSYLFALNTPTMEIQAGPLRSELGSSKWGGGLGEQRWARAADKGRFGSTILRHECVSGVPDDVHIALQPDARDQY